MELQLRDQLKKFDQNYQVSYSDAEDFEAEVTKFLIQPFAETCQTFLLELFNELNFSDRLLKILKDEKKLKKKEKTPQKR